MALEIRFQGGTSLDADGKRGAVNLMTALLEEGAGERDAQAFAAAREGLAASFELRRLRGRAVGLGAVPDREPGRGGGALARGAGRAALRPRRGRAGAPAGPVGHPLGRAGSRRDRQPDLRPPGLRRPSLRLGPRRHGRERRGADPRRRGRGASPDHRARPPLRGGGGRHHARGAARAARRPLRRTCPKPARRCRGRRRSCSTAG